MRVLWREIRGRKKAPNWTGIVAEVERAIDTEVKERLLKYPEKIVDNWEHKPEFKAMKRITKDYVGVYVYPTGPNKKYWLWTSRGTKAHSIDPVNAGGALAFLSIYEPKTKPQGPSYGGPGKSSGDTIIAMHVDHPGTKARNFEEAWGRWAKTWFRKIIENAMRRGVRRAV